MYQYFNYIIYSCFFRSKIDGAVIVTTPPEVALSDVRKQINFCKKADIPIIGVIENMSTFVCPKCSTHSAIFPGDIRDGAETMAADMGQYNKSSNSYMNN